MKYHINTILVHEKLKEDCECPLCRIEREVEEQFLNEFLNDAVMDDGKRTEVGEKGFCAEHYKKLFLRQNKLSLALQIKTRLEKLKEGEGNPTDTRTGLKTSNFIKDSAETCVICNELSTAMMRYYVSFAEMFVAEENFKEELAETKGFCSRHYAKLLDYAVYAGAKSKDYIVLLNEIQHENEERILKELQWFCDKHDYRNRLLPLGTSENVLQRAYEKLYGKKITD